MKTTHTPGPWILDASPAEAPCWFIVRAKANLCDTWIPVAQVTTSSDNTYSNGALIAAAPELMEALRECITEDGACCFARDRKDFMVRRLNAITELAKAAILKAGGTL